MENPRTFICVRTRPFFAFVLCSLCVTFDMGYWLLEKREHQRRGRTRTSSPSLDVAFCSSLTFRTFTLIHFLVASFFYICSKYVTKRAMVGVVRISFRKEYKMGFFASFMQKTRATTTTRVWLWPKARWKIISTPTHRHHHQHFLCCFFSSLPVVNVGWHEQWVKPEHQQSQQTINKPPRFLLSLTFSCCCFCRLAYPLQTFFFCAFSLFFLFVFFPLLFSSSPTLFFRYLPPLRVFILNIYFIYHVLIKAKLILMPLTHINLSRALPPFMRLVSFLFLHSWAKAMWRKSEEIGGRKLHGSQRQVNGQGDFVSALSFCLFSSSNVSLSLVDFIHSRSHTFAHPSPKSRHSSPLFSGSHFIAHA